MVDGVMFWNASIEELKKGYLFNEPDNCYTCLICGEKFETGVIYPVDNVLYDAKKAVASHVSMHPSIFNFYLNMGKFYTGLSENQTELAQLFYDGYSDKEIAEKTGAKSTSTIRNQRFIIREKYKQAKILSVLVEMIEEGLEQAKQERKSLPDKSKLVDIHRTATSVDERYAITQEEKDKILSRYFSADNKLLIKNFPAKEKVKIIILQRLISCFETNKIYSEKQIDEILKQFYDDHVTIRRYMIQYGFLDRSKDCSQYWVKS